MPDVRVNQLAPLRSVSFRNQRSRQARPCKIHIGVVFRPILEGQLLRFDKCVYVLGTGKTHRRKVVAFKQVQNLQSGNALSVWRQLIYIPTTIVARHRSDPLGLMCGEVVISSAGRPAQP